MKYEIMYIVRPDLEEDVIKNLVTKYEKILTSGEAEIIASKAMGQQRLAYEINHYKSGFYYVYQVSIKDKRTIKEFDRLALIDEHIIRHLIIRLNE